MSLWIIFLVISTAFAVKNKCPGGTYTCPDSATCCQLNDKSYGCCPMKNAVCCDDHIHCCPENTKCATGMCLQNNRSMESHLLRSNDVICDDKSVCPDDTTCCQNPQTRTFGCCPFEDAVCCDDGLHCCPGGTICNLEERKCDGDGFVTHLYDSHKKSFDTLISNITLSPLHHNKEYNVICPGEQSQCPDGYTCCKLPNQDYGCCPFVRASCCKDGLHCCPEHMHCDATSQYCSQGPRNVTSLRHIPSKKISDKNVCPDHSSCEDLETCCKMSNSTYGCCRYANATCCSDLLSCCPSDMVCDVKNKRCLRKQDLVVSFLNNMV